MTNKTLSDLIVAAANTGADPTELSSFVTDADLAGFVTSTELTTTLSDYATTASLSDYATVASLDARLSSAQRVAIDLLTSASTAEDIVAALQAV